MSNPHDKDREPGTPDEEAAKKQIDAALDRPEHKAPQGRPEPQDDPVPDDA